MGEEGFSFITLTLGYPGALACLLWHQGSSSLQVYPMKLGCPAPPGCCPHISPRPGCPGCPSSHRCALLPVTSSHMRESPSALPPACAKQIQTRRPLPRLRGPSCPSLKQLLECLQRRPCVQRPAFPRNVRISHHTFPLLLQWEVFLPGMRGAWRRPMALLSSAGAGSRHRMLRL